MSLRLSLSIVLILAAATLASATTTVVSTSSALNTAFNAAQPGDTILIAPGTYTSRAWLSGKNGTAAAPIKILAQDPNNRPVFNVSADSAITFNSCSYLIVDGIIAQGAGTASTTGNNIEASNSNHMILRNCWSKATTNTGNSDGFKFAGTSNLLMYNCRSETWGSDGGSGTDGMTGNTILCMRNYITYPTMAPGAAANGFMPKGGAYNWGFYKNTFENGSSRAIMFGGSGGQPASTPECRNSVAMGNIIHNGEAAVAFCSSANNVFEYNTVVNPTNYVVRSLQESNYITSNNTLKRNLIQYTSAMYGIHNVGGSTNVGTYTWAENYWYNSSNPAASIPSASALGATESNPAGGVNPQLDASYRPLYAPAQSYGANAPGMAAAWATYTSGFQWCWDQAVAGDPKASAGAGYTDDVGAPVHFDATGSFAGKGSYGNYSISTYSWDLNGDNVFGDATGASPTLTSAQLKAFGLGVGSHTVQVQITVPTETAPIVDVASAQLLISLHNGDANGDGIVDVVDLGILATYYDIASGGTWAKADFNHDGAVDVVDLGILATNYDWVGAGSAVPEPASLSLLAVGLVGLLRRRR